MKLSKTYRSGFTLIEVTLALGVATFCLVGVFGLLPIGLSSAQNASEQTIAVQIATAVSADLRGSPAASGTTSRFKLLMPAQGATSTSPAKQSLYFTAAGESVSKTSANPPPRYQLQVITAMCSGTTSTAQSKLVNVRIQIMWPALTATPTGTQEMDTQVNCN